MSRRSFLRRPGLPLSPLNRDIDLWLPVNRGFYAGFRNWLAESGCGASTLNIYGVAARLVFSMLDIPYWTIDPENDFRMVRAYVEEQYASEGTRAGYLKGLAKLEEYWRLRCHKSKLPKLLRWETFFGSLPESITEDIRSYLAHCRRNWPADRMEELSKDWLSHLTLPLRGMHAIQPLKDSAAITPEAWYAYVDVRLVIGLSPETLNSELGALMGWLGFLVDQERPICRRMLKMKPLAHKTRIPRDAPPELIRRLLEAIQTGTTSTHALVRRLAIMDSAWILLMLHSGMRTGEIRRLKMSDIDWERRFLRVEQSKGLKDRQIPLSTATLEALRLYLNNRGSVETLPEQVFIYRHKPLTISYCGHRLKKYYGKRIGISITPHQLRHSCATLLLNAGVPILTVQAILGHKHINTTLGYARLYDGTVAADYDRAMVNLEKENLLLTG